MKSWYPYLQQFSQKDEIQEEKIVSVIPIIISLVKYKNRKQIRILHKFSDYPYYIQKCGRK